MSALVTGFSGFIGLHLTQALLVAGADVVGIDVNLCPMDLSPRVREVHADLRHVDLDHLVEGRDVVFHLAGIPGVRTSWGPGFEDCLITNVLATQRLLEACERTGVPRLVLASSSSVYGAAGDRPLRESDAARPISPYGVSKLAAEQLALAYASKHGAATSVIALRYFSVYGPRQREDMLIARVLRAALRGGAVEIFGDGHQLRDFTFVDDVVSATLQAAVVPAVAEIVNVGSGAQTAISDIVALARRITGRSVTLRRRPAVAGDSPATWADRSRAGNLLRLGRPTPIEEGLRAQWSAMTMTHTESPLARTCTPNQPGHDQRRVIR